MKHTTLIPSLIPSLILATLASTALLAHAQYAAYHLGNFAAYGINNSGTIVGVNGANHAFSYSGGVTTDHIKVADTPAKLASEPQAHAPGASTALP